MINFHHRLLFNVLCEFIWSVDFDAEENRSARLGLKDATLERSDMQHCIVARRVVDEWEVDSCGQMLIHLLQVSDQLEALLGPSGLHEGQLMRDVGQAGDEAWGGEEALQFSAPQGVRNLGERACIDRILLKREGEGPQHDVFGVDLDGCRPAEPITF